MDVNLILSRLNKVKKVGNNRWKACCPAHDDNSPSLQIDLVKDKILLHCFSHHCEVSDILDSINLDFSDIFLYPPESSGPVVSKIEPCDDIYVQVYQAKVRNGECPSQIDIHRYKEIMNKKYRKY